LFVKKHYQPFCVRAEGDALMKLPCSGLLLSIEVCYLRTWKWGESFLFILNKHTRCMRVHIAALLKTAQQSGNISGKVAFNPSIFHRYFVV